MEYLLNRLYVKCKNNYNLLITFNLIGGMITMNNKENKFYFITTYGYTNGAPIIGSIMTLYTTPEAALCLRDNNETVIEIYIEQKLNKNECSRC